VHLPEMNVVQFSPRIWVNADESTPTWVPADIDRSYVDELTATALRKHDARHHIKFAAGNKVVQQPDNHPPPPLIADISPPQLGDKCRTQRVDHGIYTSDKTSPTTTASAEFMPGLSSMPGGTNQIIGKRRFLPVRGSEAIEGPEFGFQTTPHTRHRKHIRLHICFHSTQNCNIAKVDLAKPILSPTISCSNFI